MLSVISFVATGLLAFNLYAVAIPKYNRTIGDFALNACDSPDFSLTIQYIQKFNDSMNAAGLTSDLYNSPWGWDQTPQNGMLFEYQYTTHMLGRAHYYQSLVANQTKSGFVNGDLLNTTLANYHKECVRNGPLDWVANGAWMLKNGYYYLGYQAWIAVAVGIAFLFFGWIGLATYEPSPRQRTETYRY